MAAHFDIPTTKASQDESALRLPIEAFIGSSFAGAGVFLVICAVLFGRSEIGMHGLASGLAFYAAATSIAAVGFWRSYPHATLGLCNLATLLRLVLVAVLFAVLIANLERGWTIFAIAMIALLLDGVDGWLARRQRLSSAFGARFDMEVDAIFALVLACLALSQGAAGPLVLLLGLPSYLFFVAKLWLPWLDQSLPDLFSRKLACVLQLLVLIAWQVPGGPVQPLGLLTILAVLGLIWSFGRDIFWLKQART